MISKSHKAISVLVIFKISSVPIIIYSIFFAIRLNGLQPPAEAEMGDFITAMYFIFGASISYFIFVLRCLNYLPFSTKQKTWWWLLSCLLLLLAFDEIFMIHENISGALGIKEIIVFMAYGSMLCLLLLWNRHKITKNFLFFFIPFVFLSGIAVIADTLFGEGLINILGKEIDYEQLAESWAALALSCGFLAMAINELGSLKWDDVGK